ncbi:MAG: RbcX chaperonin protein [Acaryochloris sp. RU_4_1]|nr:RbcX chaperonin protein [Acaryochloris sp. RU_4_1]NJR56240.1 RbcX chaperonin protein [Acaryochloris sp. CRU_2_0]
MDHKRVAKDTAQVLISYLTYQAVQTVVNQLYETNPSLGIWLNQFSSTDRIQDGEVYLEALMQENPELALRLMTVRSHLAEEVTEFLPEMVKTGIQEANMEHRRQLLERMTQMRPQASSPSETVAELDPSSESDLEESSD